MRFTIEMKVQSTFYIDFISKTVDVLLISSFITKQMPKLLIFDAFTLLICKKNVAIYALLRCKIFSLKIWLCKIFDKFHVWVEPEEANSCSLCKTLWLPQVFEIALETTSRFLCLTWTGRRSMRTFYTSSSLRNTAMANSSWGQGTF